MTDIAVEVIRSLPAYALREAGADITQIMYQLLGRSKLRRLGNRVVTGR